MTAKNAEHTRAEILQAAFDEIHQKGYQAADIDAISARAGVTKGAVYYHFQNKEGLGRAVIRELISTRVCQCFHDALRDSTDPIADLIAMMTQRTREVVAMPQVLESGCPLNNMAQEMSTLNDELRGEVSRVYQEWENQVEAAFRRGVEAGSVRADIDPRNVALFVIGAVQGGMSMTKGQRDPQIIQAVVGQLIEYLRTLKPASVLGQI